MADANIKASSVSDDEFKRLVRYFWEKKEDPTSFVSWDAARCMGLMPDFYEAWQEFEKARESVQAAIKKNAPE